MTSSDETTSALERNLRLIPVHQALTHALVWLPIMVLLLVATMALVASLATAEPQDGEATSGLGLVESSELTSAVKLVLFFDMGNTYVAEQGWDFSLWRRTTGVEMRIFLPIFQAPIRFIYGYNLNPYPDEKESDFQFSIGTTF